MRCSKTARKPHRDHLGSRNAVKLEGFDQSLAHLEEPAPHLRELDERFVLSGRAALVHPPSFQDDEGMSAAFPPELVLTLIPGYSIPKLTEKMIVNLHPHAKARLTERGASESEVKTTVTTGERFPAKFGRIGFRRNFAW